MRKQGSLGYDVDATVGFTATSRADFNPGQTLGPRVFELMTS